MFYIENIYPFTVEVLAPFATKDEAIILVTVKATTVKFYAIGFLSNLSIKPKLYLQTKYQQSYFYYCLFIKLIDKAKILNINSHTSNIFFCQING